MCVWIVNPARNAWKVAVPFGALSVMISVHVVRSIVEIVQRSVCCRIVVLLKVSVYYLFACA